MEYLSKYNSGARLMISKPTIEKWRLKANWPLDYQIEQDLIISRALVEIFNHDYLKKKVVFRGGTALHKLVLPKALRYSEDIDLNRLENGTAKPVIDAVRDALDGMLGQPVKTKLTKNSIKILYDYTSVDQEIKRLKIEINVRETLPLKPIWKVPYGVDSDYFKGQTTIFAFDKEEMIGSKIRALYQRKKGRDLFDLYEISKLQINWDNVVNSFKLLKIGASRLNFEKNLADKIEDHEFLEDIIPLLPNDVKYDQKIAYDWFFKVIIPKL